MGYLLTLNLTSVATPTEMRTLVKCRPVLYTECYSIYQSTCYSHSDQLMQASDRCPLPSSPCTPHPCITIVRYPTCCPRRSGGGDLAVHSYSAHCGLATCRIILIAGSRYFIKCMLNLNPITSVLCMSGLKYMLFFTL